MSGRAIRVLILGAALAHAPAAAQMQVEARGGLTVGNHTAHYSGLELAPGVSVDVVIRRQILRSLAVYGGYFRTSFGCEVAYCEGLDMTVVGNHGALGAEWSPPGMEERPAQPWVRAGVMFGSTEATSAERPLDVPADPGIGFHMAAGLSVGSGRFRFLPGVSYRRLSATQGDDEATAVAVAVDVGFAYRLGGGG